MSAVAPSVAAKRLAERPWDTGDALSRCTMIETTAALLVISRCARWVANRTPVPELDDLELGAAAAYFDCIGTWRWCSDALLVRALERAQTSGRKLEALDIDRLRRIVLRAHDMLGRLETRIGA